jgi:signal transduction histidine kinase
MQVHILSSIIFVGQFGCLVLGAVYLADWVKTRARIDSLSLAVCAFSLIGYSAGEIGMMYAADIPEFVRALYWGHIFGWVAHLAFSFFVWRHFKAGHTVLMWIGAGLRTVAFIVTLASPFSINFTEISDLRHINFFGEMLSVAVGTRNPLMIIGHVGTLILLVYCVDVGIAVYRRGERGSGLWFAGTVILFVGARFLDTFLVMWGFIDFPLTTSPFFMGIVIAMAGELGNAVTRANKLDSELEAKSAEFQTVLTALKMAENTAHVGTWIREVATGKIWASDEWREIHGFSVDEEITVEKFFDRVHPGDRDVLLTAQANMIEWKDVTNQSYRVVFPNGQTRWLQSRKSVERLGDQPAFVYGATADVTRQMEAEDAASRLGGLLIGAMEIERSRLARELHDDLSQQIALLSIKLQMLTKPGESDLGNRIHELSEDLGGISNDIRRMSHSLHPAKLDQLGLAAAIRGFCREYTELHHIPVDLRCGELPNDISKDVSLCVYRLTQEALQNIAKHSRARSAEVEIRIRRNSIIVKIADNGIGFDESAPANKESLGLVSMHERVATLNGKLNIRSRPGKGTHIRAEILLAKALAATNGGPANVPDRARR